MALENRLGELIELEKGSVKARGFIVRYSWHRPDEKEISHGRRVVASILNLFPMGSLS